MNPANILLLLLLFYNTFTTAQSGIYWLNTPTGIERMDPDGTNRQILVSRETSTAPQGIALDLEHGKLYWTDWVTKKIQRSDLNGLNIEDLITEGLELPEGIALDLVNEKMYWVDSGIKKIQRANLDGSNLEDLVSYPLVNLDGIALDIAQGKMYWTLWGAGSAIGKVMRANLDGTGIQELFAISNGIIKGIDLDLEQGKMYWTDCTHSKIQRANLDGSAREDLVTGLSSPNALSLDLIHQKIYWTDLGSRKIQRANLDGTQIYTVSHSVNDSPQGLAVFIDYYISSVDTETEESVPVHIFPNPTTHDLKIENITKDAKVQLSDVHGRIVLATIAQAPSVVMDISNLLAGTYFVEIVEVSGRKSIQKVVIL